MGVLENVLSLAEKEIGTKESPANSNKQKYGEAYGMNGVPWCVIFIWYLFREVGASQLFYGGGKVASCSAVMNYAQKNKQWVTKNYKAGDLVIFDFPNTGAETDHIGIVKKVSGTSLTTIEGNTSPDSAGSQSNGGMVCQKERSTSLVLGAYRPNYEDESSESDVDSDQPKTPTKTTGATTITIPAYQIGAGSKGNSVLVLQILLNGLINAGLDEDGIYGTKTKAAIQKFQKLYPQICGSADGICGKNTWGALLY